MKSRPRKMKVLQIAVEILLHRDMTRIKVQEIKLREGKESESCRNEA
jgi:hypothetical protein